MYGNEPTTLSRGRIDNSSEYYLPSTVAMLQNKNLYVYCLNEPIRYVDALGLWTYQISGQYSGAFGFSVGVGMGIAIDGKGNVGYVCYVNLGAGTPNLSAGASWTYTTAPTIYDLAGTSYSAGGSAGEGVSLGVDVGTFYDAQGEQQTSVSGGIGIGLTPIELHANVSVAAVDPVEDESKGWLYVAIYGMMKAKKPVINEALKREEEYRRDLMIIIILLQQKG